jgi:hypothetical protein
LLVLSNLVQGVLPPAGAPTAELSAFLAGHRERVMAGIFIRLFAGMAFLAFIAALWGTLARAGRGGRLPAGAAFTGGLVVVAGNVGASATLAAATYRPEVTAGAHLVPALVTATHFFYVCSGFGLSCLLVATVGALAGTRLMPIWLACLGVAAAAAGLILPPTTFGTEVTLSGSVLLAKLAWIAAVGVLMFRAPCRAGRPGLNRWE